MPALPKTTRPEPNKAYLAWVAQKPCLVCRGQANVHHVIGRSDRVGRISKDDTLVTPLCHAHHQGKKGVHGLGSHREFFNVYNIDLFWEAERLWREYMDD